MQSVTLGRITVLDCVSCDGLWLDAETFERICVDREAQSAILHGAAPSAPAIESRVSYRPCVRCGTLMNRVNFAQLSGTIVDVCKGHGTFLDRGELQALVGFIQAGGLERARQRHIEDLREQQRRLKEQQSPLGGGAHREYGAGSLGLDAGLNLGFDTLISLFIER
jgi:Zn-finger nucleic acid-binding protein